MQPGVYRNLSNDDYHQGEGTSKSMLDIAAKQPAKLRFIRTNPKPRTSTAAQRIGTAFHCLILEPEEFAARYCEPFVAPRGSLVTVEDIKSALTEGGVAFKQSLAKPALSALVREHLPAVPLFEDAKSAYMEANAGREALDADDWETLENMRAALMAHPAACALLSAPGESELSAYWHEPVFDPATGEQVIGDDGEPVFELMRVRPDRWRYDGILVDLKATGIENGAGPEEFARHVWDYRYHVQHYGYLRGSRKALKAQNAKGEPGFDNFATPREFVFVVVEHDARVVDGVAMGVGVYCLDEDSVAVGMAEFRQDVATVSRCARANKWPGHSERIESLSLPAYAFTKAAARLAA